MSRSFIKISIILFIVIGLNLLLAHVSNAALSISTSKSTVSPGESFSVTVSVSSNEAGAINLSVSNGTLSSSYVDLMSQSSVTITCTAGSSGTVSIYGSGKVANYNTETEGQQSASKSVTIQAPVTPSNNTSGGGSSSSYGNSGTSSSSGSSSSGSGSSTPKPSTNTKPNNTTKPEEVKKSNDATLKSLQVEGLELYPEFNAGVKEYNVKVTNDVTAVKIIPEVNDSKASFTLEGIYENLAVGENTAGVLVTAEDGSTNRYIIKINRERESLKLNALKISYIDELGNEVVLTPVITEEVFKYTLNNIPYYIDALNIDVLSNLEDAKIEIIGNQELAEGENKIIVKITMPAESEELEDEVLEYSFTVNKEMAPKLTLLGKIQNWFKGITGTVGAWVNENQYKIVIGSLMLCSGALGGLSVYLAFAYKKYRLLVQKIAEVTRINTANANSIQPEVIAQKESINNINSKEEEIEEETAKQRGRHF